MNTLLNVIWLALAGIWLAVGYLVAGVVSCVLVVTIPFGIASFRIAGYALWPFGREIVDKPDSGAWSTIGNVVWILTVGWWLAPVHLVAGAALCLTVVGIPLGIGCFKLVPVSLVPLGKQIVPTGGPGIGGQGTSRQVARTR